MSVYSGSGREERQNDFVLVLVLNTGKHFSFCIMFREPKEVSFHYVFFIWSLLAYLSSTVLSWILPFITSYFPKTGTGYTQETPRSLTYWKLFPTSLYNRQIIITVTEFLFYLFKMGGESELESITVIRVSWEKRQWKGLQPAISYRKMGHSDPKLFYE